MLYLHQGCNYKQARGLGTESPWGAWRQCGKGLGGETSGQAVIMLLRLTGRSINLPAAACCKGLTEAGTDQLQAPHSEGMHAK